MMKNDHTNVEYNQSLNDIINEISGHQQNLQEIKVKINQRQQHLQRQNSLQKTQRFKKYHE